MSRRKIKSKTRKKGRDDHPDELGNLVPLQMPDRRMMERSLSELSGGLNHDDPRDQAQEIMYDAWECDSIRECTRLANKALELYPDCVDAHVFLAEAAKSVESALELYRKGVEAGKRDLGPKAFEEDVGYFWGLLETRPYMRCLHALAQMLRRSGDKEEAADHYLEMLRLNPNDNQGVRDELLPLLIELGRDKDADKLVTKYVDDHMASMTYGRALLTFRKDGDSSAANRALEKAKECNKHVPSYLLGKKKIPAGLPDYHGIGDTNEAILVAHDSIASWTNTPGALEWLVRKSPLINRLASV